jgi:alpha-glucuronidase
MTFTRREFVGATVGSVALLSQLDAQSMPDEDGSRLWLRYDSLGRLGDRNRPHLRQVLVGGNSPTARVAREELTSGIAGMVGAAAAVAGPIQDGAVVVGTPETSPIVARLNWRTALSRVGREGFIIRQTRVDERSVIVIASESEVGALYGAFRLLRMIQTGRSLGGVNLSERPKLHLRLLNHWDNLDGTIERGYAGRSLWQWNDLPGVSSQRYVDYARANASIGINGAVVNSVNANVRSLAPDYLAKTAALADVFRPYGVRVYLAANFAAPVRLGGLATADPLDPAVIAWWKAKTNEIYALIPDFGGFCVKANSEGQPGPKDYKRNHAEGANVLAAAVAPHGGHVMWRAFIYDEDVDPDRAKRAYLEFTRLDGQFLPNVLVQVKNGAIDFMPREPFHPLFGALKKTPIAAEIQPTQEYLGQARHLVYLGTMWEEFLHADTHVRGPGSTVGRTLDGSVDPYRVTGLVSVVNPGLDRNWCGHHFSQSNWYAAGRLAWDHTLGAKAIADEWTRMTWGNDPATVATIVDLMMGSRETFVNYTMPLGLHHLIGGDHYAPMPENGKAQRADWTATYYHQASKDGVGFDRTMRGNKAVDQYAPAVRNLFDNVATCPEEFLLWFHRLSWTHRVKSGRTVWDELVVRYHQGAAGAAKMQATWRSLAGRVDARRHKEVADRLAIQVQHAAEWRDHILRYFQTFSQLPINPPS